jgi:signal transduction histidine kinase
MSMDTTGCLDRMQSCGGLAVRWCVGVTTALSLLLIMVRFPYWATVPMVVVAALATAAMLFPQWMESLAVTASVASIGMTAWMSVMTTWHQAAILFEDGGLLVTLLRVVWKTRQPRLLQLTVLLSTAFTITPLRFPPVRHEGPLAVFYLTPMIVLVGSVIGVGVFFRALDDRRARALASAREGERLELARDLHDFVAHHVTGIVVQAQAARFVARSGSPQSADQLDSLLGDIEKAGAEALTSMRRLVGLLREPEGASVRPVGDLAQLQELVGRFTDPPAILKIDPDLPELPPEIATTVHRIVQEALTNARKHAADATAIRVGVVLLPDKTVEVTVRDNGRGGGYRLPSGRFGLVGLDERVRAVGGTLRTGPRVEGGWEVLALLPLEPKPRGAGRES